MSKTGRTWFPLDVNYTADDKILAAGEPAGWLYLAMLGRIYLTKHQGVITRDEVAHLGVARWQPRMARLVTVGLVEVLDDGTTYHLPAWTDWQGNHERAEYMRKWRAQRNTNNQ